MPRSDELIRALGLQPHPEGGFYAEIYRSTALVVPDDARGARAALTTIYFLLAQGQRSRLHRVTSDEAWHFYEGDPLELTIIDRAFEHTERITLGPVRPVEGGHGDPPLRAGNPPALPERPVHVVPAGMWQAARPLGAYTLVGCTVAPGFEFADFSMLTVETRAITAPAIRVLRSAWLRPFDRPEDLVYPGDDHPAALHIGAVQDGALIGISSVAPGALKGTQVEGAWQLRGVAVHPGARGEGIGHIIMERCMVHVAAHGGTLIWCNARVAATSFYAQLGFERIGEPFEVPGTGPHYVMKRTL